MDVLTRVGRTFGANEQTEVLASADPNAVQAALDIRAMLERATRYEPSVVEGRFMIHAVHQQRRWIVIVEPDVDARILVVVTPYEVSP